MRSTPLSLSAERAATGTTLLRVMLDAHRNICCGPELKVLPELARLYQMMTGPLMPVLQSYQNTADDVSQHLRAFVEGLVENLRQHSGKPRWAEKTPHNVVFMRELGQIFPDAQFLHVIRDGRDVGCSLVTMDWTDPTTGRKVDYIANIGNEAAIGLKRGTNVVGGQDVALRQEMITELYDKGEGSGPLEKTEDVFYNTGLAMYSIVFEAARRAAEAEGLPITAQSYKAALETLEDYDANGLMAPITVTAEDHGGGGKTRIEMWDGETWVPQTDWISEYSDVVWDVVKESSSKYGE